MTRPRSTAAELHRICAEAQAIRPLITAALAALDAALPGPRSTPIGDGSRGTTDHTARAIGQAAQYSADPTVRFERDLARRVRRHADDMEALRTTLATWASNSDTNHVRSLDIWCQWCARHDVYEPHRNRRAGGLTLCQRCYRWQHDTGKLPTPEEIRAHAEGRKPRRQAGA